MRRRLAGAEAITVRLRRPVDFIQLSKSRGGERPIREEPRALITVLLWELGRLCPGGSRRRAAGDRDGASEGKREPYLSIQDGKKGFGDFRIVFMGIQTVTGFFGGMTRRNRRVSRIVAGIT